MVNFFKKVGKGLSYLFVFPLYLVVIPFLVIYALIGFLAMFIKSIFMFFTGRSLYEDLPEDKQVKTILEKNLNIESENNSSQNSTEIIFTTPIIIDNKTNTTSEESSKEETQEKENDSSINKEEAERSYIEEIPESYNQTENDNSISENTDDNSGVDLKF